MKRVSIELENDKWMCRAALATMWKAPTKYYYIEFDFWDSPTTSPKVPGIDVVNWAKYDPL